MCHMVELNIVICLLGRNDHIFMKNKTPAKQRQTPEILGAALAFPKIWTLQRPENQQSPNTTLENQPEYIDKSEMPVGQLYIQRESSSWEKSYKNIHNPRVTDWYLGYIIHRSFNLINE